MKNLLYFLFFSMLIFSCSKDDNTFVSDEATTVEMRGPKPKVTLCHNTGSETNPFVMIEVNENAVDAHIENHGDYLAFHVFVDGDGDGFGDGASIGLACEVLDGYSNNDSDCNDGDADVNPGVEEVCDNGIDDNCDSQIDEDCVPNCPLHDYLATLNYSQIWQLTDCSNSCLREVVISGYDPFHEIHYGISMLVDKCQDKVHHYNIHTSETNYYTTELQVSEALYCIDQLLFIIYYWWGNSNQC